MSPLATDCTHDHPDEEEDGLCVEELLRRQNKLLKDIHKVAIAINTGFAAAVMIAKFLTYVLGLLATIGGAIGLFQLWKGGR